MGILTYCPTVYQETHMQSYNVSDINALGPCRPATHWVSASWTGTLADILVLPQLTDRNKIWAFSKLGTSEQCRLFAVWCAREALALIPNPDPLSIAACCVAEAYARGDATEAALQNAYASAARAVTVEVPYAAAAYATRVARVAAAAACADSASYAAGAASYAIAMGAAYAAAQEAQVNYAYYLVTGILPE